MANLIPFHGVLYNPANAPDISRVVAPPYDVIDAAFQQALHARHPHNVIRLELGLDEPQDSPGQNRYTRAAALLKDWMAGGVLQRERAPGIAQGGQSCYDNHFFARNSPESSRGR